MRLLLDEHFSVEIARELRKRGHAVIATTEDRQARHLPDEDLLTYSTAQGRALVTEDVGDFMPIHGRWLSSGQVHCGVVFVSRRRFSRDRSGIGRLVHALGHLLTSCPADDVLSSQTLWLQPVPD